MSENQADVVGGVDTHRDVHVAAAVDTAGRRLGTASFPTDAAGCADLAAWLGSWGRVVRVGVEGTGSYGAGLARGLAADGVEVVEVNRPNRQTRRRRGKSDSADAEAAARSALCGDADAEPKSGDGPVEAIRILSAARRSAVKARSSGANQICGIVVTAPENLKDRLRGLATASIVEVCARMRPDCATDATEAAAKLALLGARGVGAEVASALLVAAGDNPERMRSEASFAALRGTSPIEASSGATASTAAATAKPTTRSGASR